MDAYLQFIILEIILGVMVILFTFRVEPYFLSEFHSHVIKEIEALLRSQGNWRWEGPLGTPLGLVHWKRASSPVEAGTSGFL